MAVPPRYRIIRRDTKYLVQKWFAKSWFWKEGWYSESWGYDNWVEHGGKTYTLEEAQSSIRDLIESDLPKPDDEPIDALDLAGEQLREKCLANPKDDGLWLVYSDWLEENGFLNNAERIRQRIRAMKQVSMEGIKL